MYSKAEMSASVSGEVIGAASTLTRKMRVILGCSLQIQFHCGKCVETHNRCAVIGYIISKNWRDRKFYIY